MSSTAGITHMTGSSNDAIHESSASLCSRSKPLLHGIVVPMVTPLTDAGELDVAALELLIDHLIDGGVHGLFLLGTCGEGPSLSYRLRRDLISRTCQQVGGRVPIVVGIADTSLTEATAIGAHAADAGADAVVVAPPYYYPLDQGELVAFVQHAVQLSALPVILYNMPSLTKVTLEPETVRRLLGIEKIIGVKDSSGDLAYFERLLAATRERPDWSVMMGPELLLVRALRLGAHGGVCGGANIFPRLLVNIYEAAKSSDSSSRLSTLLELLKRLGAVFECGPEAAPATVRGLKSALAALGIGNGSPAEPLGRPTATETSRIAAIVHGLTDELCA